MNKIRSLLLTLMVLFTSTIAWAQPLNINTADAKQIAQVMNGVGPNKARAIVNYREQYGPFIRLEDITKVRGIGKSTLEKNRAALTVSEPITSQ